MQLKQLQSLKTLPNYPMEKKLELKYFDHNLLGDYVGYRKCHVEPEWIFDKDR